MYDIKYKIGTKIYQIDEYYSTTEGKEECIDCEGFGYLRTLGTESNVKCLKCAGTGKKLSTCKKWEVSPDNEINFIEIDRDEVVRYMNKFGNSINDKIGNTVFFTKEDAQTMCDKLNKKELK